MLKRGPLILIDNAPIHRSEVSETCLKECGFKIIETPKYSPDLAPSDYYLFRNLKTWLRSVKFETREELESQVSAWFASKPASYFEHGIDQLPSKMRDVIKLEGAYLP